MRPGPCLAALALAGCVSGAVPDPSATLSAYAAAVARDDAHAAYGLLAASVRARLPEAEFTARWRATVAERRQHAEALRRAAGEHRWRQTAHVESAGRVSPLVRETAGWRVDAPRRIEVGAATPEEALRRFVQALEDRNLDGFLRLLSEPLRQSIERELGERLTRLKAALGKPVTVEGERARVRYDPRYHIDLQRENGQWRVADFN
jgi:hypothetical protein